MTGKDHELDCMRYLDGEMNELEIIRFEAHLHSCKTCRKMCQGFNRLKEVTDTMKVADLPQAVWEGYWNRIYNRIERSVAWFLFIIGLLMLSGYCVYQAVTEPGLRSFLGLALLFFVGGFAVLFLSVLREKNTVNRSDQYIREVKR